MTDKTVRVRSIDFSTIVFGFDPDAINPNEIEYEFGNRRFYERPMPRGDEHEPVRPEWRA